MPEYSTFTTERTMSRFTKIKIQQFMDRNAFVPFVEVIKGSKEYQKVHLSDDLGTTYTIVKAMQNNNEIGKGNKLIITICSRGILNNVVLQGKQYDKRDTIKMYELTPKKEGFNLEFLHNFLDSDKIDYVN